MHDAVAGANVEPGLARSTVQALGPVLASWDVSVRDPFVTGPSTFAATVTVPAEAQALALLAQFVVEDGRPVLSVSTACAIAMRNGISCTSPLPFAGALWRDPVVLAGHQ